MSPHPHAKKLKEAAMKSETMEKAKHATGAAVTDIALASVKAALKQNSVKGAVLGAKEAARGQLNEFLGLDDGDLGPQTTSSSSSSATNSTSSRDHAKGRKSDRNGGRAKRRSPRENDTTEAKLPAGHPGSRVATASLLDDAARAPRPTPAQDYAFASERKGFFATHREGAYNAAAREASGTIDRGTYHLRRDPFQYPVAHSPRGSYDLPLGPRYQQPSSFHRRGAWDGSPASSQDSSASCGPIIGYHPPVYQTKSGLSPADDAIYGHPVFEPAEGKGERAESSPGASQDDLGKSEADSRKPLSSDAGRAQEAWFTRSKGPSYPGQPGQWRNSSPSGSADSGGGLGRPCYSIPYSAYPSPGMGASGHLSFSGVPYRGGQRASSSPSSPAEYAPWIIAPDHPASVTRTGYSAVGNGKSTGYSVPSAHHGQDDKPAWGSQERLTAESSSGTGSGIPSAPPPFSRVKTPIYASTEGTTRPARYRSGINGPGRQGFSSNSFRAGTPDRPEPQYTFGVTTAIGPDGPGTASTATSPTGGPGYARNLIAPGQRYRIPGSSFGGYQPMPRARNDPGFLRSSQYGSSVTSAAAYSTQSLQEGDHRNLQA